jgi:hypothetical protein
MAPTGAGGGDETGESRGSPVRRGVSRIPSGGGGKRSNQFPFFFYFCLQILSFFGSIFCLKISSQGALSR